MSDKLRFIYFLFSLACFLFWLFVPLLGGGQILLACLNFCVYLLIKIYQTKKYEGTVKRCEELYKNFIENSDEGIARIEIKKPININLPIERQIKEIQEHGHYAECNNMMSEMLKIKQGDGISDSLVNNLLNEVMLNTFVQKNYNIKDVERVYKNKHYLVTIFGVISHNKLQRIWCKQKDITSSKKQSTDREILLQQAREAKNLADLAHEEKNRVLASLSHELKTPLISIIGYANILNKDTPKDELENGLQIIRRNGKAQLDLVEDLLSLAHVTSGRSKIAKTNFNLGELIKYRVESLKYRFESKGLKVVMQGQDVEVFGDELKIGQIFNNIFSNAIKFTNEGTINIKYGFSGDSAFFFSVKDSGIGISKADRLHLFTQYFQVNRGANKSQAGIGLGLYIAKTFTSLHKGRIEVESELGQGSTFTVYFPINGNDLRDITTSFEGTHVLMADDNTNIGEIDKLILQKEGAFVTLAKNKEELNKLIAEGGFDLYVFDIEMPDEDGLNLMKRLRKSKDRTPSVAISTNEDYETEAMYNGFNLFIVKPLTPEKIKRIKTIL